MRPANPEETGVSTSTGPLLTSHEDFVVAHKHEFDELVDLREECASRSGSAPAQDVAWREGYPYEKRRRARTGLLHTGSVPGVHALLPRVRADAGRLGHAPDQAVVLGEPGRTGSQVRCAVPGPGQAGEALCHGQGEHGQVAGIHRSQGSHVPLHRHPPRALDGDREHDKKRARLEAIRHVLAQFDYPEKDARIVGRPDKLIVGRARRLHEIDESPSRLFP